MSKVSVTINCQRRLLGQDFLTETGTIFICREGLDRHWRTETAKRIEIRLHNKKANRDAHKFTTNGPFCSSISIKPEKGEGWGTANHGVFSAFGALLAQYKRESGTDSGWMEVNILE